MSSKCDMKLMTCFLFCCNDMIGETLFLWATMNQICSFNFMFGIQICDQCFEKNLRMTKGLLVNRPLEFALYASNTCSMIKILFSEEVKQYLIKRMVGWSIFFLILPFLRTDIFWTKKLNSLETISSCLSNKFA